jgi:hypothetical protein
MNVYTKKIKIFLYSLLISCILSSCIKNKINEAITNSIKVAGITVQKNDLPNKMNWLDAKLEASKAGNSWRLPTRAELKIMYDNRNTIGGFDTSTGEYWSSEEFDNNKAWIYTFGTPGAVTISKTALERVRLVK